MDKLIKFISIDIWRITDKNYSKIKFVLLKLIRNFIISFKGFIKDNCVMRASALTFFSLLSIVPIFAMLFGIAKGFGFESKLESIVIKNFQSQGQEQIINYILQFSNSFIKNSKGGIIAGIGIGFLFWTVIKLLSNIETSFNYIWGITKHRSFKRKISDYLAMMLISPVLFIIASSLTIIISSQINFILTKLSFLELLKPGVSSLVRFIPFTMIWLLFTFLYIFMPNTKIKVKYALIGGFIAGILYQLIQWTYITFQIGAAKYSAIYGSFAALPLFLIWINLSWIIILYGAEVTFAFQNSRLYEFEPDCRNVSPRLQTVISIAILNIIVKNLIKDKPPLAAADISNKLNIPIRLINLLLDKLIKSDLLIEIPNETSNINSYLPVHSIDKLTLNYIITKMIKSGNNNVPFIINNDINNIGNIITKILNKIDNLPENILISKI